MSTARDKVRERIFSAEVRTPRKRVINLFGEEVEIRQPTFQQILQAQENPNRAEAVIDIILLYCYIPGTDELVFDASDRESLMSMPFGVDFVRASEAVADLTNVKLMEDEARKP